MSPKNFTVASDFDDFENKNKKTEKSENKSEQFEYHMNGKINRFYFLVRHFFCWSLIEDLLIKQI